MKRVQALRCVRRVANPCLSGLLRPHPQFRQRGNRPQIVLTSLISSASGSEREMDEISENFVGATSAPSDLARNQTRTELEVT